jgi:hypothetical protein|tara:strand:- start:642 stop:842 length:201 start_codon:yes stop_codon:yes gene_type:complete
MDGVESMYIDPIDPFTHMVNLNAEIKRLEDELFDAAGRGEPCDNIETNLSVMYQARADGHTMIPLF